jgi:ATP-dependent RNA helicase DHX29
MQGGNKLLTANYTSIVHALPLSILAGEASFHLYAGVVVIDGNRLRFSTRDERTLLMLKKVQTKIRELIDFRLTRPPAELDARQKKWMEIFLCLFQRTEGSQATTKDTMK